MRTTVTLDAEVAAAVEQLRRKEHIGVSEAINTLARRGLLVEERQSRKPFRTPTYPLGIKIDISCVADALEQIEGPEFK